MDAIATFFSIVLLLIIGLTLLIKYGDTSFKAYFNRVYINSISRSYEYLYLLITK